MNPIEKALAQADKIIAANRRLEGLSQPPRIALYVDETMETPEGFIPSLVTENEAGHSPLAGKGAFSAPWYFGHDLITARRLVDEANAKLGLTPIEAIEIVASSMRASNL